jgi:hypothetical protein
LVGVPSEQVASTAYRFLQSVSTSADAPTPLRLKSLKVLASVEASKARSADAGALEEQREAFRIQVNNARRAELKRRGLWQQVCVSNTDWMLKAGDHFELPNVPGHAESISKTLDRALELPPEEIKRRRDERREMLLQVRAANRDDNWRELIHPAAAAD